MSRSFFFNDRRPRKSRALRMIAPQICEFTDEFKVRISALPSVIPDRNNVVPKSHWTGRQDWGQVG